MATSPAWVNNQAYIIANSAYEQATGRSDVKATDTNSFVDMGRSILNSNDMTEGFLNSLVARMARVYYTYRSYESDLKSLMVDSFTWGAIVQKIDGEVPDFVRDETFELEEGKSVDMYVVRKPTASQKFFIERTTYSNYITISRKLLQGAFTSESAFNQFVGMIFAKMRIRIDLTAETLARLAIANAIANLKDSQKIHLVTLYNQGYGLTGNNALKSQNALNNHDFLTFAVSIMNLNSKRLTRPSVSYNAEGKERHTPLADQRFLVYDEFQSRLETVVQYSAFHEELVKLKSFIEVPYWQGELNRTTIKVTNEEGEDTTVENIVAAIFDRYTLGTFKNEEEVNTTPYNARGRYYNTFYHLEFLWYNALDENMLVFLLD